MDVASLWIIIYHRYLLKAEMRDMPRETVRFFDITWNFSTCVGSITSSINFCLEIGNCQKKRHTGLVWEKVSINKGCFKL